MDKKSQEPPFNQYLSRYSQKQAISGAGGSFYSSGSGMESGLNPRQLYWIQKRKVRREILDALIKSNGSNYLYESRHVHAMKRQRAASGRFLTKEEIQKAKEEAQTQTL